MIISFDTLAQLRNQHHNKKIVLSSGTFDLFHVNHLYYLEKAREYGDVMVVMVSNDTRVRLSKGESRPVYPELDRAAIIDGLKVVNYVFIEPGKNKRGEVDQVYMEAFARLRPDIFVTANEDWNNFKEVIGSAKLVVLPRAKSGYHPSTSAIIEHVARS